MDIKKYKSVAVQKEVWARLWEIAKEENRTPANQIEWFVNNHGKILEFFLREKLAMIQDSKSTGGSHA